MLQLRFGLGNGSPHTLSEVGQQMDISRERVRQIENEALRTATYYLSNLTTTTGNTVAGTGIAAAASLLLARSRNSSRESLGSPWQRERAEGKRQGGERGRE